MINDIELNIFGDSIMKGVLLNEETGKYFISDSFPNEQLERELGAHITNRSIFGCTVTKGSKLVSGAVERGAIEGAVLVEYGGNDCNFAWKEVSEAPDKNHDPITPPELFSRLYRGIIDCIKNIGATPVMMTLPPIDAQKYLKWITKDGLSADNIVKWLGDANMIYRFQELYSGLITKLAYETGTLIIDVRSYFLDKHNYSDLLCADGIHPNREGQKLIGQALFDFGKTVSLTA